MEETSKGFEVCSVLSKFPLPLFEEIFFYYKCDTIVEIELPRPTIEGCCEFDILWRELDPVPLKIPAHFFYPHFPRELSFSDDWLKVEEGFKETSPRRPFGRRTFCGKRNGDTYFTDTRQGMRVVVTFFQPAQGEVFHLGINFIDNYDSFNQSYEDIVVKQLPLDFSTFKFKSFGRKVNQGENIPVGDIPDGYIPDGYIPDEEDLEDTRVQLKPSSYGTGFSLDFGGSVFTLLLPDYDHEEDENARGYAFAMFKGSEIYRILENTLARIS